MWTAAVPWMLRLGPSVVSVAPQHLQLLCSRKKPSGRLLAEGTVHPPCRVTRPHTVWPEPIAVVLTLYSSLLSLVCLSVSRASRQSFTALPAVRARTACAAGSIGVWHGVVPRH